MPRDVGVVVVAAGRGERAGGGLPKQFRTVAGVPLALRAVAPFRAHPAVAAVSLVVPPGAIEAPPDWLAALAAEPGVALVAGGAERADSVRLGLAALPPECSAVLVHDAARPFVDAALIDRVLDVVRTGCAAVPAVPVSDTLKRVAPGTRRIAATVSREELWRAQTPQGFPRAALERAHHEAHPADLPATDDAALVERLGIPVAIVDGAPHNLKITTADDFVVAECLAAAR